MKIGYDAKRLFNNTTGLGNYSRTLITSLAQYHPEHEYHLFSPKKKEGIAEAFETDTPSVFSHFPEGMMRNMQPLWRSYFQKNDIKKAHIDIYHGLSAELPLSIQKGVKTVVTIHDLIHERYPEYYPFFDRKMYSWKFKSACQKADKIVAISEQTKQDIIDFYKIKSDKIEVIYQSCHPQFKWSNQLKLGANFFKNKYNLPEKYLLYVGSIIERKNLLGLLKSLIINNLNQNTNLVIVGKGKGQYLKDINNFIEKNNLKNRITFLENLDFEDFPFIYKNALALVYPSFFEGFGIPIIEALSSGCPVITSEGSCFAEAGGKDSLYINPHKPETIDEAIFRIDNDKVLREQMILRGWDYVKKFEPKAIADTMIELYNGIGD